MVNSFGIVNCEFNVIRLVIVVVVIIIIIIIIVIV